MTSERDLLSDERWQKAQEYIQAGEWDNAWEALQALLKDYPHEPRVRRVLMDVELRRSLSEEPSPPTVKRIPVSLPFSLPSLPARRYLTLAVLIVVFVGLGLTAYGLYKNYIAPARMTVAAQQRQDTLYQQAQAALVEGDYARAEDLLTELITLNPDYPGAKEALEQIQKQRALAKKYQRAVQLQEEGNYGEALRLFREIYEEVPDYRDVERRLRDLEEKEALQTLFRQAETAYAKGDWERAIRLYEGIRQTDSRFRKEIIRDRLFNAYMAYARELLNRGDEEAPSQALEYVRKALTFKSQDENARALYRDLKLFLRGYRSFEEGDYRGAIKYWADLWEKDPEFGNGLLARLMYQAYVQMGRESELVGDLARAIHLYMLAAQLPVLDKSVAEERLSYLFSLMTPTPTPTPTATPTPTPLPTATPTATPTPTPTSTPTPLPQPLSAYPGWIAFKTDRRGVEEVWVMKPDGCCARPVADPENFEKIREKQRYAPNGKWRVYVEAPGDSSNKVNIYIWRMDVPANWEHKYLLLDNGSINYDPVFSPDSQWIAFVSQVTGNDEIWKISSDFFNPKPPIRLTNNTWEWDKSPTWSPDGKYIAFWSNRVTGRKQIWIMNADGSNQRNISNNEHNDWDPVWLWPSYFKD